jgi:hypothetical protein
VKFARRSQNGEEVHLTGDEKRSEVVVDRESSRIKRVRNIAAILMAEDGWTTEEVGCEFGLHRDYVSKLVRSIIKENDGDLMRWDKSGRPPRRSKEIELARGKIIRRLTQSGITADEIFALFHITRNKIARILNDKSYS